MKLNIVATNLHTPAGLWRLTIVAGVNDYFIKLVGDIVAKFLFCF